MMSESYPQEASVQFFLMSYCQSLHRGNNYIKEAVTMLQCTKSDAEPARLFYNSQGTLLCERTNVEGNKQISHQFQTQEMQTPKQNANNPCSVCLGRLNPTGVKGWEPFI